MTPQIENSITNEQIQLISYPSKTYKLNKNQIAGKVDNLEAIQQSIYHILSIERYTYLIYDDNYGVELQQYIGKDFSYLEATIENTLKEALTQDDRILDVKVTDIYQLTQDITELENSPNMFLNNSTKSQMKIVNVEFDVYCKQGIIHTEVKINV